MRCPGCGAECKTNVCELCGTKLTTQLTDSKLLFYRIYIKLIYKINCLLLPPAKVMFIIWTMAWALSLSTDTETSFTEFIPVIILGYVFYCGLADLIYIAGHKRHLKYKYKILSKTKERYYKVMQKYGMPHETGTFQTQERDSPSPPTTPSYDLMEGHDFEYFCADVLKKNGFIDVTVTQGSGDHGIDILAEKDDITYAIQCKCYSSNIGNAAVQQAHTGKALYHKDVAVVMTNRYFTSQAKDEAAQLGVKLWDRDKLNFFVSEANRKYK